MYRSADLSLVIDALNEVGLADSQQDTSFTDGSLPAETFLSYLVRSEDGCGNESS